MCNLICNIGVNYGKKLVRLPYRAPVKIANPAEKLRFQRDFFVYVICNLICNVSAKKAGIIPR